ncbi:tripartite tricarboxylate transporter substrate binding protein BugD [Massilia niastensis]|uniref:tripartite tricarboxylate transporter substrate binding protein BugD n=1 Tax=Massilia niastensis TaxID=544911 RepID=UPI000361B591|nr:tripartite tricarboxylate transporter substrate binding protein BugD [Massilia niastensis]
MKSTFSKSIVWLALAASSASYAADYPNKTITMVVPFAAGGPTDTIARLLAQAMGANLKQQVIVENVGGAGGTLGAARVARSSPDGYTIFVHHVGHATAPSLYRKLPYSSIDSFEPIGLATDAASTLIARKDFPAKDIDELLAYVKANKEKVTLANAGLGAASHLCGMLFMSAVGTELTTVPYKGTGPAMNDLLGGQVDLMCDQATNTMSHIKSGKVKAYAVTYKNPVASLPGLPPLASAGLPGFELSVWHGVYAPKSTPKEVVNKLSSALQYAVKDPTVKQRLSELSTEPVAENRATPEALRAHLKAEIDKWSPIIKKSGSYAE